MKFDKASNIISLCITVFSSFYSIINEVMPLCLLIDCYKPLGIPSPPPLSEVDLQLQQQESEYQELAESMRQLESRRKLLEEEKLEADTELEKQRVLLDQRTRELEMLTKDFELAKEREAVLMGDR